MPITFESLVARIQSPSSDCLLGLALIAENKRTPLYDVLTVALCFTNTRSEISAERAQSALESLATFDLARLEAVIPEIAPSGKLRLVIITDVGLRTVGTVDTDDWVALVCLCDLVRLMCTKLDYLTVVLAHRKKNNDYTEPEDVSKLMAARIGESTRVDDRTFVAFGTTVRVFQQHRQTTPNSAQRALSVEEMLVGGDESEAIRGELEVANAELYAHLRDVHLVEGQNTVVLGCGPVDVLTARTLGSCVGWTISYGDDSGVNSGRSHTQYQHSNCGASVFASYGNIVDVTTGVTRATTTTDDVIQRVCDTPMLVALAENTTKVAARPLRLSPWAPSFQAMEATRLFWRIFASNVDTLLPSFWSEFASAPARVDVAHFCARVGRDIRSAVRRDRGVLALVRDHARSEHAPRRTSALARQLRTAAARKRNELRFRGGRGVRRLAACRPRDPRRICSPRARAYRERATFFGDARHRIEARIRDVHRAKVRDRRRRRGDSAAVARVRRARATHRRAALVLVVFENNIKTDGIPRGSNPRPHRFKSVRSAY